MVGGVRGANLEVGGLGCEGREKFEEKRSCRADLFAARDVRGNDERREIMSGSPTPRERKY